MAASRPSFGRSWPKHATPEAAINRTASADLGSACILIQNDRPNLHRKLSSHPVFAVRKMPR